MPDFKDELLEVLKRDAYKKGEFKLSSGRESNHYVNCKPVTLSGRGLTLSSLLLLKQLEHDSKVDHMTCYDAHSSWNKIVIEYNHQLKEKETSA